MMPNPEAETLAWNTHLPRSTTGVTPSTVHWYLEYVPGDEFVLVDIRENLGNGVVLSGEYTRQQFESLAFMFRAFDERIGRDDDTNNGDN